MTKLRPPLSFELALQRIASSLPGNGWAKLAEIAGQADRTVRNWSDPDTQPAAEDAISIGTALKFDTAYRLAGLEGAPMLQCFANRLEAELLAALPDSVAIAEAAAKAAIESGQAVSAAIAASLPGASSSDLALAKRELEESIGAQQNTLALVCAASVQSPGGETK